MTTSRKTFALSEERGDAPIPGASFAYLRTRNRLRAYQLVQAEFRKSGISQKVLAKRLKKDAGQLSRLLNAPGNLTLDTFSDLMFAISGAVPTYGAEYPLQKPARNMIKPEWSEQPTDRSTGTANTSILEVA